MSGRVTTIRCNCLCREQNGRGYWYCPSCNPVGPVHVISPLCGDTKAGRRPKLGDVVVHTRGPTSGTRSRLGKDPDSGTAAHLPLTTRARKRVARGCKKSGSMLGQTCGRHSPARCVKLVSATDCAPSSQVRDAHILVERKRLGNEMVLTAWSFCGSLALYERPASRPPRTSILR